MRQKLYISVIIIFWTLGLQAQVVKRIGDTTTVLITEMTSDTIGVDTVFSQYVKGDTTIIDTLIADIDQAEESEIEIDTVEYEDDLQLVETLVKGRVMTAMITPEGDTLIMETLDDISITSLRTFKSNEDYLKYMKFKRYAAKVYPYAKEAIRIFRETEYATQNMKRKKRKKYIAQLQDELKEEFEEPLSRLTKLQGKILVKMIERELDETMYNLLKGLRGRIKAFTWHNFGKLYSYDLKEGYQEGKYEILDAVLQDFNISYRIEQDEKGKS
jgi:hypothetical protein